MPRRTPRTSPHPSPSLVSVVAEEGEEPRQPTIRELAENGPEYEIGDLEPFEEPSAEDISAMFNQGTLKGLPPAEKNEPIAIGSKGRRKPPKREAKTVADVASDYDADKLIHDLAAAGLILLIHFSIGNAIEDLNGELIPSITADEADALATPISRIISRRINIAAKLGPDGEDAAALAIALMAYFGRVGPTISRKVLANAGNLVPGRNRTTPRPAERQTPSSVDAPQHDGAPTNFVPFPSPFDALAAARENAFGGFGGVPNASQG